MHTRLVISQSIGGCRWVEKAANGLVSDRAPSQLCGQSFDISEYRRSSLRTMIQYARERRLQCGVRADLSAM